MLGLPEDTEPVLRAIKKHRYFKHDARSPDFYLVVGGDGAILEEKNKAETYKKPILQVHYRRNSLKSLGFNADVGLSDLRQALDDVRSGEYTLQREQLLECHINQRLAGIALNDITVKPSDVASTLLFRTIVENSVRKMELLAPKCDGIIVSTRYGSPAWNLSYGGPISLDLPLMTITFPGSNIKHEHYVCSLDDTIRISVSRDSVVILDNDKHEAANGSRIEVKKSGKYVSFIHTKNTFEDISSKAMRQIEFSSKRVGGKSANKSQR